MTKMWLKDKSAWSLLLRLQEFQDAVGELVEAYPLMTTSDWQSYASVKAMRMVYKLIPKIEVEYYESAIADVMIEVAYEKITELANEG